MAATTQSGNLLDPATWGGSLPGPTEASQVVSGHVCTLTDGQILETGDLTVSGQIETSGVCEITGTIIGNNAAANAIVINSGQLTSSGQKITTSITNPGVVLVPVGSTLIANELSNAYLNSGDRRVVVTSGTLEVLGQVYGGTGPVLTVLDGVTTVNGLVRHQWSQAAIYVYGGEVNLIAGIAVSVNSQTGYGVRVFGGTLNVSGSCTVSSNNASVANTIVQTGGVVNLNSSLLSVSVNNFALSITSIDVSAGVLNVNIGTVTTNYRCRLIRLTGTAEVNVLSLGGDMPYRPQISTFYVQGGTLNWKNQSVNSTASQYISIDVDGGTVDLSGLNFSTAGSLSLCKLSGSIVSDSNTILREETGGHILLHDTGLTKQSTGGVRIPNIRGGADQ